MGKPIDLEVRKVVTEALVSMVSGVTGLTPPSGQPLPDFIQAPVDRAVERIRALLCEQLEGTVPLYEAVERACGELPDGWSVLLNMERGSGCVELYDSNGVQIDDFPSDHERLDYTINDAIEHSLTAANSADVGQGE
ncbi:hypothetical protein ABRP29_06215 [Pseudomonas sp. WHRI 8822A]|uniref:hypothetical protein n=1 Tax=Pseudomonas sp. WHRI 8822A TaxID=3162568 RepID=UPI0032EB40E8